METGHSDGVQLHLSGGFSLDAIAHADGRVETGRLGGNALWAAMGALLAERKPYPHAVVGEDYPEAAKARFEELGFDISGIRREPEAPGVRVTFSYRDDGSRSQPADPAAISQLPRGIREQFIDTTQDPAAILASLPHPVELPVDSAARRGWHLGLLPVQRFVETVAHLAGRCDYLQADTPARNELARTARNALDDSLPALNAFLPSTSDTDVFLPNRTPGELLRYFHDRHAALVVLKLAERGALVSEPGKAAWLIPAFEVKGVVDATGAGDVFAGAFAAEMLASENPVRAASLGAAAASFAVSVQDPLGLADVRPDAVRSRARWVEERVVRDA